MVVPQSNKREQVLKLIEEKDKIEAKINELGNVLRSNNIGMTEPLTDAEDFPRNDIDVMAVRQARHEINCLQNDLKQLMSVIEKSLEEIHKEGAHISSPKIPPDVANSESSRASQNPFLIVNVVTPGGPAEEAGIHVRDQIIQFGSINFDNFQEVRQIGDLVRHSQNQSILLKVKRNGNILDITLIPKVWHGQGLLGCNVVPIDHVNG